MPDADPNSFDRLDGALVLGGCGFIGSRLLASLAAAGVSPLVCLDLKSPAEPIPGVTYVTGDVRQPLDPQLRAAGAPAGFEVLFNLAAVHVTPGHPDHEYYDTNVLGALMATALAVERGIDRIVFTSSISTYGPREQACDEDATLNPISAYGRSKRMAELIHAGWQSAHSGRQLVTARPAVVFGPGERGNFTRLIKALRRGFFVYPGRSDTIKGCGYVDDLVRSFGFALALDRPRFLYNFALPDRVTTADICAAILDGWGGTPPRGTVPLALLHAAARGFEVAAKVGLETGINRARVDKLVTSTWIVPRALTEAGFDFTYDLPAALREWRRVDPDLAYLVGR